MLGVYQASALAGEGLEGDRHAKAGSARQVLLMDRETLSELDLGPGAVRENITVEGAHLQGLASGSRISLGSEVVLELSGPCVPCRRMEEIRPGLQETLEGRRGVLATVARGGTITVGDPVVVSQPGS